MAADVAGFLDRFPEFKSRDPDQISRTLADVELRVSSTFGAQRDQVVYLTLADTLSTGAQGRATRKDANAPTPYRTRLVEFHNTHALGRR